MSNLFDKYVACYNHDIGTYTSIYHFYHEYRFYEWLLVFIGRVILNVTSESVSSKYFFHFPGFMGIISDLFWYFIYHVVVVVVVVVVIVFYVGLLFLGFTF